MLPDFSALSRTRVSLPEGQRRVSDYLATLPFPDFEQAPDKPGYLVRIGADDKRTIGRFVNRHFRLSRRPGSSEQREYVALRPAFSDRRCAGSAFLPLHQSAYLRRLQWSREWRPCWKSGPLFGPTLVEGLDFIVKSMVVRSLSGVWACTLNTGNAVF